MAEQKRGFAVVAAGLLAIFSAAACCGLFFAVNYGMNQVRGRPIASIDVATMGEARPVPKRVREVPVTMPFWENETGICVNGDGEPIECDSSPCGVATACCGNAIPTTLTLSWASVETLSGSEPGGDTPIVYDGSTGWYGNPDAVCSVDNGIRLICSGTTWKIQSYHPSDGSIIASIDAASASCDPLLLTFSGQLTTNCTDVELKDLTVTPP